jgi:protein TonB
VAATAAPAARRIRKTEVAPPPNTATPAPFVEPSAVSDLPAPTDILDEPAAPWGSPDGNCDDCVSDPLPSGDGSGTEIGPGGERAPISVVIAPHKTHDVTPAYPKAAITMHLQGDVLIECVIGVDGRVKDARVVAGHPILRDSAITAVRQWTYQPTRLNGEAVSVRLTVTVRFRIQR